MQGVLDWLTSLPSAALYLVLGTVAAIENIFPPIPADTVVAFGSFLAARGHGTALGAFLSTWGGNVGGAAIMYVLGRRYGAGWVERKMAVGGTARAKERFSALYGHYGMGAIFLSRFIPGVRALVPPLAGALGVRALPALGMIALASGLWYGLVTWVSFKAGESFDVLQERLQAIGGGAAVVAAVLVLLGAVVWYVVRRRSAARS